MADEMMTMAPATNAESASNTGGGATSNGTAPTGPQLTQLRVPLFDAAEALTTPDASGRPPIVILPLHGLRIRNELVAGGVIALGVGLLFDVQLAVRTALVAVGVALIVLGALRSIFVGIPEGSRAILLRRGRFDRTLDS